MIPSRQTVWYACKGSLSVIAVEAILQLRIIRRKLIATSNDHKIEIFIAVNIDERSVDVLCIGHIVDTTRPRGERFIALLKEYRTPLVLRSCQHHISHTVTVNISYSNTWPVLRETIRQQPLTLKIIVGVLLVEERNTCTTTLRHELAIEIFSLPCNCSRWELECRV